MEDFIIKLTYTERNGLLYPDLDLPPQKNYPLGKYGRLRLDFLKQHRRGTYGSLRAQAKLNEYLHEIDVQAIEMVQSIISDLASHDHQPCWWLAIAPLGHFTR